MNRIERDEQARERGFEDAEDERRTLQPAPKFDFMRTAMRRANELGLGFDDAVDTFR